MLGCSVLGGHGHQGGPSPGRLQICERTDLLVLEINTVSCCSQSSAMDAGHWPARGCGTPWIYRSISGEYACLEKRFTAHLGPARPGPRVRQEATAPPQPAPCCAPRGLRRLGKEAGGNRAGPRERKPRRSSADAAPAQSRGAAAGTPARRRLEGGPGGPLPAAPPSYETHMLRRLRAGQGGHKPHEPRPPPYVSPPAYDAPHRTLPTKRPRAAPQPPPAAPRRSPEPAPCPAPRRPRLAKEVLGGWSYHAGSGSLGRRAGPATGGRARCPARGGSAESLLCRVSGPDGGSHTLPRAAREVGRACPAAGSSAPGRQRLPSGWGFGYAPSPRPGRQAPPSPRPAGPAHTGEARRPGAGGVFVIDATGAVIRAEFIPAPPRRPPPAAQPDTAWPGDQRAGAAAPGTPEPLVLGPGAASPQEPPGRPPAQAGWEVRARPCAPRPPLLCARDLREAVSRIRRHTAPDSDSEPEEPTPRGHMAWRARQRSEALSYSSSSLESNGSAPPPRARGQ